MVLTVINGGFGNALFQIAAAYHLSSSTKSRLLIFTGVQFHPININHLNNVNIFYVNKFLLFFINFIFCFFTKYNIFSSFISRKIFVNGHLAETKSTFINRGLFKCLIISRGYFQHDKWICNILHTNKLYYKNISLPHSKNNNTISIGIHVRLGDYKYWEVLGFNGVVLPFSWYINALNFLIDKIKPQNYVVYFFSDEPDLLNIGCINQSYNMSTSDQYADFAKLSTCDHLIISPSSFSYFAALINFTPNKVIIAPTYWTGFKFHKWAPLTIKNDKFIYLDVS